MSKYHRGPHTHTRTTFSSINKTFNAAGTLVHYPQLAEAALTTMAFACCKASEAKEHARDVSGELVLVQSPEALLQLT